MDVERWKRIKRLFEAALQRAEPEREPFLDEACSNDPELRRELDSLLSGERNAGDFLKEPVAHISPAAFANDHPPPPFSPGEIASGRFEILRFIGRGGMGEVYEARDLERHVRVALKTVRPEIASNPKTMARFKREIDLALRVTHHNVCRVYDLERHRPPEGSGKPDVVFLTMELLEGETLSDRLRRQGRMSCEEALPLIRQMAEGLAAAHLVGVIHRDFKPGNVMLVPEPLSRNARARSDETTLSGEQTPIGTVTTPDLPRPLRAVITDFGLAKPSEAAASISDGSLSVTAAQHLIGTPAYMAPEQLDGGEVTPATDVYAFGLVLYEMVTARRPFSGSTSSRIREAAPSPRVHLPDLDPRWESVIVRCLEVDPHLRFATAQALSAALAAASASSAGSRTHLPWALGVGTRRHLQKRGLVEKLMRPSPRALVSGILAVLILAALVSLFAVALRVPQLKDKAEAFWSRLSGGEPPGVKPGTTVFLTDIKNDTGDPQLNGVTELLRSALGQSAHFNLMGPASVCEELERMRKPCSTRLDSDTARGVAWRGNVPRVVLGDLSKPFDDYVLYLEVDKPGSDPTDRRWHWNKTFTASSKNDLFDCIRDGSDWVRKTVGEARKEIDASDRPPQDITTDSWEALELYNQAEQLQRQDQHEQAVAVLREAVAKDPQFALAYMRMGDILVAIDSYAEGFAAYQRVVSTLADRRLSKREELRIKGLYAIDTDDFDLALTVFETYSSHFGNDYHGFFYQAYPSMALGQTEHSIELLRVAEGMEPNFYYMPYHLAKYSLIDKNFDESARNTLKLRELGHQSFADAMDGESSFLQGQYKKAWDLFHSLRNATDSYTQARSYLLEACLFAEQGRYREAEVALNDGIEADKRDARPDDEADKYISLAYLAYRRGDRAACRAACLQAHKLDTSWQRSMKVGTLLARTGYVADARAILNELGPSKYPPLTYIVEHRLKGEILLAEGDKSGGLKEFELKQARPPEGPVEDKEYLARAYMMNGDLKSALAAYKEIALNPGRVWYQAEIFFPGAWADSLFQYAALMNAEGNGDWRIHLADYLNLRKQADPSVAEVGQARKLLHEVAATSGIQGR